MSDLLITRAGGLGRITLNRAAALNALTYEMMCEIQSTLLEWAKDGAVKTVLIDGAGPKAFCAGGDVAMLYARAKANDFDFARKFWSEEYVFNDQIANYPKPLISMVHGFCMGGGVGLACHLRYRILDESAKIAMPECGIGLVPDVGGTALLTRAPSGVGPWMALTGARLEPKAAIDAGFFDHFISQDKWADFRDALSKVETASQLDQLIARYASAASGADLPPAAFRRAFEGGSVGQIIAQLSALNDPAADVALAAISKASPLAMATALAMQNQLQPRGNLRAALSLELRATLRAIKQGDFVEGVRARLIDRDNQPEWKHRSPEAVSRIEVCSQLAELREAELTFQDFSHEEA